MSELVDPEEVPVGVPTLTLGWRMQMAMTHGHRTIEQMALACGVGRSTVSRWIHDTGRRPRRGDLEVWARECRVPFGWLAPNPEEMDDFVQLTAPKVRSLVSIPTTAPHSQPSHKGTQSPLINSVLSSV